MKLYEINSFAVCPEHHRAQTITDKYITKGLSVKIILISNKSKVTLASFTKGTHKNHSLMLAGRDLKQISCPTPC